MAPRVCDKCGEWVSPHRVLDHRCKPELLRIMDGCDLRIKGEIDGVVWEICQKYHLKNWSQRFGTKMAAFMMPLKPWLKG